MTKIVLEDVRSGYNLSAINTNFDRVEQVINDNMLSRDGVGNNPNEMKVDLDMNGKRIYNLPVPVLDHEAARLEDVKNQNVGGQYNKTLRVNDLNIPAFPDKNARANRLMSFDADGNPRVQFPSADSATQLRIDLAEDDGGSLIGYKRNSVNAISRTVQQMLDKSFVTPQEFGAVADGVADDTLAIQRTWEYCSANKKPCLMTDGDYHITDQLRILSNLHVMFSNNAWIKPSTWAATGAFITNVNIDDVADSYVENVLFENTQLDGININTTDLGNSNAIGIARGAVDVKFLGGTIKNVKYSFNFPGGAGGKAIGVEQGVNGFFASNFWIENCSVGIFSQGVPGVWTDGTPRSAVGIHFSNIHCENTEAWGFFAGVTTGGDDPSGDFAEQMVMVSNITYHNCGHAPNRPIGTDHKKSAPLVFAEASGVQIDGVEGYNDPDYPMVNPGYPTDPALIGFGLSGPIGAVMWGWGRNCSVKNVRHYGDVDAIFHIERARAHGDDAGPTTTPRNVFRFDMHGFKHYGTCDMVLVQGAGTLGPDENNITGKFEVATDIITTGFVGTDWGMSNGVTLKVTNGNTNIVVEGTPFYIRSFKNTFTNAKMGRYFDQVAARVSYAERFNTDTVTIPDDGVYIFRPTQQFGIANFSSNTSLLRAIVGYRCSATGAQTTLLSTAVAGVAVTTGVLTGTTGSDGNFTVSADASGNLYFENRRGASIDVFWTITV